MQRRTSRANDEQIKEVAYRIYLNRQHSIRKADDKSDWSKAESICKKPLYLWLFWLHQPLVQTEKKVVERIAQWVDQAALFRIIEKISPPVEAVGVIAIPFVLFLAGQQYQEKLQQQALEVRQQQAVKDYLSQLSSTFLSVENDIRDPKNERLRVLVEATTLTFLDEPNLNGKRKGQVVRFLAEIGLVNRDITYGPERAEDVKPDLDLSAANLSEAFLDAVDLRRASLRSVNLSGAELTLADLNEANLSSANLNNANLSNANLDKSRLIAAELRNTKLRYAGLRKAKLFGANLSGANLTDADLSGADLSNADLKDANLSNTNLSNVELSDDIFSWFKSTNNVTTAQVDKAYLCNTRIPESIDVDPNRDCNCPHRHRRRPKL